MFQWQERWLHFYPLSLLDLVQVSLLYKLFFLGFLLLSTTHAFAADEIYAYNFWAYDAIKKYTAEISASPAISAPPVEENGVNKCLPVFKNPIKNGVFDIHYALGYFDDSQAIDVLWNNANYGLSPSLDIGIFKSIIHRR